MGQVLGIEILGLGCREEVGVSEIQARCMQMHSVLQENKGKPPQTENNNVYVCVGRHKTRDMWWVWDEILMGYRESKKPHINKNVLYSKQIYGPCGGRIPKLSFSILILTLHLCNVIWNCPNIHGLRL